VGESRETFCLTEDDRPVTLQEREGEAVKPSELKDILDQHRLWLESDGKQGKRANLQRANLRNADLREVNLWGANLWGANLQYANLQYANLRVADLQGANLQGATFDLNFKQVGWFADATFSECQFAWVCLHPKYPEWADTLKWVKAEKLSA
jgi:hypothetical protein